MIGVDFGADMLAWRDRHQHELNILASIEDAEESIVCHRCMLNILDEPFFAMPSDFRAMFVRHSVRASLDRPGVSPALSHPLSSAIDADSIIANLKTRLPPIGSTCRASMRLLCAPVG